MRYLIVSLLVSITLPGFCQDELIIDPIQNPCVVLVQEGVKIESLRLEIGYTGLVVIEAACDTSELILSDHKIIFANLRSIDNPLDSIEIRVDNKNGAYTLIEDHLARLIEHISHIEIRRTNLGECIYPKFSFPIRIE